jgi:hypothetical protein
VIKNFRSVAAVFLLCVGVLIFTVGCPSSAGKSFDVNSKVYFSYTVPANDPHTSLQPMFFKISNLDIDIDGDEDFIIGTDVILAGENTDQLIGGSISVVKRRFREFIEVTDNYYSALLSLENSRYNMDRKSPNEDAASYPDKEDIANARKLLKPYISNAYAYAFTFLCDDENGISKSVVVDSMRFKDYDISFDFDYFKIEINRNISENQIDEVQMLIDGGLISSGVLGGGGAGEAASAVAVLEGTAIEGIASIEVFPLNDSIVFATKDNREFFREYEKNVDYVYYRSQKMADFKPGEEIRIDQSFVFADELNGKGFHYDDFSVNYGIKVVDNKGNAYITYDSVNSISGSGQLMAEILHEELGEK